MKKIILLSAIILLVVALRYKPESKPDQAVAPAPSPSSVKSEEIIAQNLQIPWDVDFLPAAAEGEPRQGRGEILVTERPGNLLVIKGDKTVIKVDGVRHIGEGGLMGIAVHPDFKSNNWLYLYFTSQVGSKITNRVERYKLSGNQFSEKKVIIEGIPGSSVHDGGQLDFGRDDLLYITTGDAGDQNSAQDKNSLNGKILRLKDDGSIPDDNPFGNAVYSYGHRNPQGIAWDDLGRLWATEHGPSGNETGNDELNLIEKGKNYGWPVIRGTQKREGMETPVIESGTAETWAPSGLAYHNGRLFFSGLRGSTLYAFNSSDHSLQKHLINKFGRLRAAKIGPDNMLYITTSNTDGRGTPRDGDD